MHLSYNFTKYTIYDQNRLQSYWIEDVEMKNVHWDYNMFPLFAYQQELFHTLRLVNHFDKLQLSRSMQPDEVELASCKLSWEKGGVSFTTVVDGCFSRQIHFGKPFSLVVWKVYKGLNGCLVTQFLNTSVGRLTSNITSKRKSNHAPLCKSKV